MASNELFGLLLAFSAACCWGFTGVLYKAVIRAEYSLFLTMVFRGLIAVPFLAFVTHFTTGFDAFSILFQPDVFPILILSSFFVTFGDWFFFASLKRIDVSKSQPVAGIYPLFTILLLISFGMEEVSLVVIVATLILIIGIGLVSQQESSSLNPSLSENKIIREGLLLSILAAVFWSFGILSLDYLLEIPGVDVFSLATIRFSILTLIMALAWLFFDKLSLFFPVNTFSKTSIQSKDIFIFGLTGILSWGVGGVAFFKSIELIDASRATPISSINPVIAIILGIIFLKEKFSSIQAIGILLVCIGTIAISVL